MGCHFKIHSWSNGQRNKEPLEQYNQAQAQDAVKGEGAGGHQVLFNQR